MASPPPEDKPDDDIGREVADDELAPPGGPVDRWIASCSCSLFEVAVAMAEPSESESLDLLTVADVCALFKVTKDWVYDEVEAGRLPNVKLGRKHLRFRRLELEGYLAEHLR